jgi:dTDP-4-amino-4,6-dideoxygalactose transaminase
MGFDGEGADVPIFRPSLPPLADYVALLTSIWKSQMLSNFGAYLDELEAMAAAYLGVANVVAVTSGDLGLVIALKALDLPAGSPAFVSTFTFNSTLNAAIWNDLQPVLVDIDPTSFNLSVESLRDAMDRYGAVPGVVVPTHVFGAPCDTASIAAQAEMHGHRVVYDAAHAYGSMHDDRRVGGFGAAEVFSLSGTKLVTSAEGGLIATDDGVLAERMRAVRSYGFAEGYRSDVVGINGKMSELHAALGLLTLPTIEREVARRHEIAAHYRDRLGPAVGWQHVTAGDRSTYKDVIAVLGSRRDHVERSLDAAGVQTRRYFVPLHTMPAYRDVAHVSLRVAEEVHASTLALPAFSDITVPDLDRVCLAIESAMAD